MENAYLDQQRRSESWITINSLSLSKLVPHFLCIFYFVTNETTCLVIFVLWFSIWTSPVHTFFFFLPIEWLNHMSNNPWFQSYLTDVLKYRRRIDTE